MEVGGWFLEVEERSPSTPMHPIQDKRNTRQNVVLKIFSHKNLRLAFIIYFCFVNDVDNPSSVNRSLDFLVPGISVIPTRRLLRDPSLIIYFLDQKTMWMEMMMMMMMMIIMMMIKLNTIVMMMMTIMMTMPYPILYELFHKCIGYRHLGLLHSNRECNHYKYLVKPIPYRWHHPHLIYSLLSRNFNLVF